MKLGELIDLAYNLREEKRKLDEQSKDLGAQIDELKAQIMEALDEQGTISSQAQLARAVVTETVVPRVDDWDAVINWIMENDGAYLLTRRISSGAYREMVKAGDEVPGLTPFTKRDISLTKRK